jgi:TonB-linked SusC/RagA family outer membrane protein
MKHYYLNFIRLMLLLMVIAVPDALYAQGRIIKGRVLEAGTTIGIPGATVVIKGTTNGTVTDVDGNYQIEADNTDVLVYSFVGYQNKEVLVGAQSQIDVSLAIEDETLEELIVVGYGSQERARVTGAISSVSSKEIGEQPVASVDQALQGRAAGITVANSGSPGVNPVVRIRGLGTVGNNNPLYVIDGMPAGGINEINPNDIESVQVLKDASASAIYGSRAANGVILVTTKRGVKGKTSLNADAYYGYQTAWRTLDLLNRDQYLAYGRDLINSDPKTNLPSRFGNLGEFANVETDWQDEMFRTAPIRDFNLSASGGGDNSLFNISGGYFKQDGIMLGTGFERYSIRANSEFTIGRFKVGETLTTAYSKRQNEPYAGGRTQIEHMIKMVPYIPVRDADKVGGYRATDLADGTDPENPVLNAMLRRNWDENLKLLGTAYASFEIMDGLEYKLLLGMDMNFGYNDQFVPMIDPSDTYHKNPTADIDQNRTDFISPLISNQLSFNRTLGNHHIDAVAVAERQTHVGRNTRTVGESSLTSEIDVPDAFGAGVQIRGQRYEYALISYLGRVNYDYVGKYLLSASVRRDGGSRFGNEKWGTFPSFSAGWRVSEEPFLRNVSLISEMKIRASWGQVGNDGIGNYGYQATIANQNSYVFGEAQSLVGGAITRAMANPDIKWETTTMTNIGIDLGFLKNRIRASVEYFNNETEDMLLNVPIPFSIGFDVAPVANLGAVTNKGFEVTAGYYKSAGDFQWSLGGNISFVRNELTSLGIGSSLEGAAFLQTGYNTTFSEEGQPIAYFRGWVVDGIFQNQEEVNAANNLTPEGKFYQTADTAPGDIRFKDLNDDGVVDDQDRTNLGHFLPDFSYGLNASANYRNFDLSLFIQGVEGNEILNVNGYNIEGMTRLFNSGTAVLNRWTTQNPNTDVPRAINSDPNRNARISDRFVEDGSYLRVKNLSVGYTLPTGLLNNLGNGFVKRLRVYVTSQNLLTFTDYTGYDPEIGVRTDLGNDPDARRQTLNSGVDFGQYPQPRTFIGGIQIGF